MILKKKSFHFILPKKYSLPYSTSIHIFVSVSLPIFTVFIFQRAQITTVYETKSKFKVCLTTLPWEIYQSPIGTSHLRKPQAPNTKSNTISNDSTDWEEGHWCLGLIFFYTTLSCTWHE